MILKNKIEENRSIKKPLWKDPKIAGPLIVFIVSLLFNVLQYSNAIKVESRFAIKEDQWKVDKKRLNLEILKLKHGLSEEIKKEKLREKNKKELKQIVRNISIWKKVIFKKENELLFMQNELMRYENEGKKLMGDASRQNIALQKNMIKRKKQELKRAKKRRIALGKR